MKTGRLMAIAAATATVLFCVQLLVLRDDWKVILGMQPHLTETQQYEPWDPYNIGTRTFQSMEQQYAWQNYYNELAPAEGDPAPDFELSDVTGEKSVRLSDFRGDKPVALIFGSFT